MNGHPFSLVQLSDCHVSADPDTPYRDCPPLDNLKRLAPIVANLAPDAIVLSGDVSEDGSKASYEMVADLVGEWGRPIAWLPGNHDERPVMEEVLDRPGFVAGPLCHFGGWQVVLLDSAWHDRPEGELDEERLAPLDELDGEQPALVFVHHQPIAIGSPWIDKYPLIDNHLLWNRLDSNVVRAVAFGHVHQAFAGEHRGISCLAAPSTVANSYRETPKFTLDDSGPGLRWFRLWPDGKWQSGVEFAPQ
jgi:3',5'-cyclic-AMP phosphodiesterase